MIMIIYFRGDYQAIKRMAFEFCEDEARNGVLYVEARFSAHLLVDPKASDLTPAKAVEAVLEGFKEGEDKFKIKVERCLKMREHLK